MDDNDHNERSQGNRIAPSIKTAAATMAPLIKRV